VKYFIGLDIGTSKIGAVMIDSANAELVSFVGAANDSNIAFKSEDRLLWSEQSPKIILERVFEVLHILKNQSGVPGEDIDGIGITGQMHGVVVVDEEREPVTNLITWEDRRCLSLMPDKNHTYLDVILDIFRNRDNTGCIPSSGYMGCTLFWLSKNNLLPYRNVKASFISDFVCSQLTGGNIYTDITNAASSGVFDILKNSWYKDFIDELDIPYSIFPEVLRPGEIAGKLQSTVSEKTGIPCGIPVCCAVGDNQASVLGSLKDWNDIVINIGTGSQISFITDFFNPDNNFEMRPFFDDKYLLVGAALCGGRAYTLFRRLDL